MYDERLVSRSTSNKASLCLARAYPNITTKLSWRRPLPFVYPKTAHKQLLDSVEDFNKVNVLRSASLLKTLSRSDVMHSASFHYSL